MIYFLAVICFLGIFIATAVFAFMIAAIASAANLLLAGILIIHTWWKAIGPKPRNKRRHV